MKEFNRMCCFTSYPERFIYTKRRCKTNYLYSEKNYFGNKINILKLTEKVGRKSI